MREGKRTASLDHMTFDMNKPRPLSEWVRGTMTLHFVGGGTMARRTSHANAIKLRRMLREETGPDALRWGDSGWIATLAPVAAMTWEAAPDCGLPLTPARRERQAENGHQNGMLRTLVDDYEDGPEPSFSAASIIFLSEAAGQRDLAGWRRMVRLVEGVEGAAWMEQTKRELDEGRSVEVPPEPSARDDKPPTATEEGEVADATEEENAELGDDSTADVRGGEAATEESELPVASEEGESGEDVEREE